MIMKMSKLILIISHLFFIYISRVHLVHSNPLHGVQVARGFPTGPTVTAGHPIRRHLIACTTKDRKAAEPSYVWIRGQLEKKNVVAEDGDEQECKVMANGFDKIKQMSQKMKQMRKSMKKMARHFEKIVNFT